MKQALVNEKAAAATLGLAVTTLRRWRWAGCGPDFVRLGRAVRYDPAVLSEFIDFNTRRSTSDGGRS